MAAIPVAHQNRLDRSPVGGLKEGLVRTVAGVGLVLDGQGREGNGAGQLLSEATRQVRHVLKTGGALRRPSPDLAAPVGRLVEFAELAVEQFEIHGDYGDKP